MEEFSKLVDQAFKYIGPLIQARQLDLALTMIHQVRNASMMITSIVSEHAEATGTFTQEEVEQLVERVQEMDALVVKFEGLIEKLRPDAAGQ